MTRQRTRQRGFTLIELMIAMLLMSMVTATCIWVFRQSLTIYNKSTGNAEVNQNWRIAMEKINQDLSACLPLSSGEQRFQMISRHADDEEFGRSFPRDFLSFTTTSRVAGASTTAQVSYDIIETASKLPILMRYVSKVSDLTSGSPTLEDGDGSGNTLIYREVLAEYCTMFRVEYLWEDPRREDAAVPGSDATYKQIPDPGVFLHLHPDMNENGGSLVGAFAGGLNGIAAVENPTNGSHAGGTDVQDNFYDMYLLDSSATKGIQIPFRVNGGTPILEPLKHASELGMVLRRGSGSTIGWTAATLYPAGIGPRNRAIQIMSPNLWHGSNLDPSDEPLDITANYSSLTTSAADTATLLAAFIADFDPVSPGASSYFDTAGDNEVRFPTYVPSQLRITMKIYNKSRTSMITREKTFWIPSSGS